MNDEHVLQVSCLINHTLEHTVQLGNTEGS